MGLKEVKAKLRTLKKDDLIRLFGELYKKNKTVKEYLDYWLEPNEEEIYYKYRQKVIEAFFPKQGHKVRLKQGKQAISDFKKFAPKPVLVADLMLLYVESGTVLSAEEGVYDPTILTSLHKVLYELLNYNLKYDLMEIFRTRFDKLVIVSENVGGFFYDILVEMLFDFVPDFLAEFEEDEVEEERPSKTKIIEFPNQ